MKGNQSLFMWRVYIWNAQAIRLICVADDVKKVVKGEFKMDTQYHFPMETLSCVSVPTEDGGLDIFCTTQWLQIVQETVSLLLNMPQNK